jgi:cell division protein FtsQ
LFYLNRRSAVRSILSDQSYIDKVDISVKLPNTVQISVTECIPLAYIRNGNDFWIIDRRGKLLEVRNSRPDLTEITGLNLLIPLTGTSMEVGVENDYKISPLLELLELLSEQKIRADSVKYDTVLGISFTYLGRFNVIVGLPEFFEHKLDRLPAYVEQLEPNATGTIYLPEEGGRVGRFVPN